MSTYMIPRGTKGRFADTMGALYRVQLPGKPHEYYWALKEGGFIVTSGLPEAFQVRNCLRGSGRKVEAKALEHAGDFQVTLERALVAVQVIDNVKEAAEVLQ